MTPSSNTVDPQADRAAPNTAAEQASPTRVVIAGAGIAGLGTALALSRHGARFDITIIERDPPPPIGDADAAFFDWRRLGAAQFRHPHAFLGLLCNIIEEHYPELLRALTAAGARRVGFEQTLPPALRAHYEPAPGDEKLWVLMCRRATIETVIRRHVESLANVSIRSETMIEGLISEPAGAGHQATGLRLVDRGAQRGKRADLRADLIVDASGRNSKFPRWLAALGYDIPEERDNAEIVYYTRHYRLTDGESEPAQDGRRGAGDLGYLKYGVFPGDNGHFAIILCLPMGESALREAIKSPADFDRVCRAIPGLAPWLAEGKSAATTDPFGIGDINAVWRHFPADPEQPLLNFFAVGDAALRTNPLYGRGCSTGMVHAHLLADVLTGDVAPAERPRVFAERTEAELRPIFAASLAEDKRGIRRAAAQRAPEPKPDGFSLKRWFGQAFGEALGAAARENLTVMRGIMRTVHLLEPPGAFLKDSRVRLIVLRYMLRGQARNGQRRLQPGPDRAAMHDVVGLDSS